MMPAARVPQLGLSRATVLAAVVATVTNGVVWLIAEAAGLIDANVVVPGPDQPITLGPVALLTVAGIVAAAVVLAVLRRTTAAPGRVYRVIVAVVAVVSMAAPLTLTGAPVGMIVVLWLLHVVAAAGAWSLEPLTSPEAG